MSIHAILWVFHRAPTQDPIEQLVLLALAEHADEDGSRAWPSIGRLARYARLSTRSVQRAMKRLEAVRVIDIERGAGPRGQHVYRIVGCQRVTPDGPSPLTESHRSGDRKSPIPRQSVRGTGVSVSPDPSVTSVTPFTSEEQCAARAVRSGMPINNVKRHLKAAAWRVIESGECTDPRTGILDVGQLTNHIKTLAAQAFGASWDYSSEVGTVVDGVVAQYDKKHERRVRRAG